MVAGDDFGVKSVALTANGLPVATLGRVPYEFEYTPAYEHIGDVVTLTATITDSSGQPSTVSTEISVPGDHDRDARDRQRLGPRRRSRSRSAPPASFGAFTPGIARIYTATTSANVVSTAGDALLSVIDPSTTAPGHLVNGTFSLPRRCRPAPATRPTPAPPTTPSAAAR